MLLDEADSFLNNRLEAQRKWEVTQVNELLTQMEAFEGVFICTTNLMEKLDPACLRRFSFKVKFDYMRPEQRWSMFQKELQRLGGYIDTGKAYQTEIMKLEGLTPGDFAVASKQFDLWNIPATADKLFEQLEKEAVSKGMKCRRIGF